MHYFIFICSLVLILEGCLTPRIHAMPLPGPVGVRTVFEIAEKGPGQCSNTDSEQLTAQYPNMVEAAMMGAEQLPDSGTITSPHTSPVVELLYGAIYSQDQLHAQRMYFYRILGGAYRILTVAGTKPHWATRFDTRILCDSTGVQLMGFEDPVPWPDPLKRTIGQLYDSGNDYWYLYVEEIRALGRVKKANLPIPEGAPYGNAPFPTYPGEKAKYRASFCADTTKQAWSFYVDKYAERPLSPKDNRKGIIILCPSYFQQDSPNEIATATQQAETPLEVMKPAWFEWFCQVATLARPLTQGRTDGLHPAKVKSFDDADLLNFNDLVPKKDFITENKIATTADECARLARYQQAEPVNMGLTPRNWPTIYNPANYAWLIIAIYLQQAPEAPQSWATGYAGELLPRDPVGGDGGCQEGRGTGGEEGGGSHGGSNRGSKRPRPDDGDDGRGNERPRLGGGMPMMGAA